MSASSLLRRQANSLATPKCWRAAGAVRRYAAKAKVTAPGLELPETDQYRSFFKTTTIHQRDRISLANVNTAAMLGEAFIGGKSIAAGRGKTVIEAFPGPGALSRGLLQLEAGIIEKLIILEQVEEYLEWLYPLAEADPRVSVVPRSGYSWDTYQYIEEQGLLDHIKKLPFEDGVHPQLHFISHIPQNIKGEQLVAQLFRNIPDRSWLFKYGRVPMSFVLGEWIWERVSAIRKSKARCKVSVIAEATAQLQTAVRPASLQPYDVHFHPIPYATHNKKPESRRIGHPLAAVNIVPLAEQLITPGMLDKWDYVLRRLFVLKSTPFNKAIGRLAFGAESLLKPLTDESRPPEERVDVKQPIRDLTVKDWALIMRAFDEWPFAPESLVISDSFNLDDTDGKRH
ncbi:SAM-dependent methyltransferase [Phanerochaete sordida]|uniref:rRNA adenine N(6)-methyltransferase n=1 Tax=Phanerochaete sordida TaxID=48140 RepID=A0A9P3GJX7_9APHY|nr:SAM-dependent methyltransferase [Phanerochaete sordida]